MGDSASIVFGGQSNKTTRYNSILNNSQLDKAKRNANGAAGAGNELRHCSRFDSGRRRCVILRDTNGVDAKQYDVRLSETFYFSKEHR